MKFTFFAVIFFASNLGWSQGYGMSGGRILRKIDAEAMRLLDEVQEKLKIIQEPAVIRCGDANGAKCEFTLLCEKIRTNRNAEVLYQNSDGKILPNFSLVAARRGVDQCRNSVSEREPKSPEKIVDESVRAYQVKRGKLLT